MIFDHVPLLAKKQLSLENIDLIDILRWVYENTQQSTWDGLYHWAVQSLNYQRKMYAFRNIQWENQEQKFTNKMMKQLADECLEPEIIELKQMYGSAKVLQTVENVYLTRYQQCHQKLSKEIHNIVLKRLHEYGGTKQRLCQLLDDEQQRELEHELEEERQSTHPSPAKPCSPKLHEEIKRLCDTDNKIMELVKLPNVFRPLPYAFTDTTFFNICQVNSWQSNLWISTEFQRVIETKGERLNSYLRLPRWIVVYRNQHIIFISAFEANWLMGRLNFLCHEQTSTNLLNITLRLLLPRIKRNQSIFVNTPTLTIPSLTRFSIPIQLLVQLFIFNGTLYFETVDEQTAYCQCLGLCPKPQTIIQHEAFEKEWIAVDGFVSDLNHRRFLSIQQARFISNPLTFVKRLIENRNNLNLPISSHVGSIICNSTKLL